MLEDDKLTKEKGIKSTYSNGETYPCRIWRFNHRDDLWSL